LYATHEESIRVDETGQGLLRVFEGVWTGDERGVMTDGF
jgi:hypothetical protein